MTLAEFAMYRLAAQLMSPELRKDALELAKLADAGDVKAAKLLREIVETVILTEK